MKTPPGSRVSHQKEVGSPKPGEDWAKNRFGASNPPRIGLKTDLEPKTRQGLRQNEF
nr:MAG TPA: hypothetical protein [Caudoviricetes sp.]